MKTNKNKEVTFFHFLKTRPEYFQDAKEEFFKDSAIRYLIKIVKLYHRQFKKNITDDGIEMILKNRLPEVFMVEDEIDKSVYFNQSLFDTIMSQGHKDVDKELVKKEFEAFLKYQYLRESAISVSEMFENEIITPDNIDTFQQQFREISNQGTSISFDFDLGTNVKDAQYHQSISKLRFSTGYTWFDKSLDGGFCPGELICMAGPSKGGKSLFMSNFAINQVKNGKNVAIVTLEMLEHSYTERLTRNWLSLTENEYRSQINEPDIFQKKLDTLKRKNSLSLIKPGDLYVKFMPTSQATIPIIEGYLSRLEDYLQKKIDLVILDYINLCNNYKNPNSENLYVKIGELAKDFRDLLNRKKYAGLTGTQLNREGMTSDKADVNNISESKALVDHVDGMFSVIVRSSNDVVNKEIRVKQLAVRNGEKTNKLYKMAVNWDYYRISEKSFQEVLGEEIVNFEENGVEEFDNEEIFAFSD